MGVWGFVRQKLESIGYKPAMVRMNATIQYEHGSILELPESGNIPFIADLLHPVKDPSHDTLQIEVKIDPAHGCSYGIYLTYPSPS